MAVAASAVRGVVLYSLVVNCKHREVVVVEVEVEEFTTLSNFSLLFLAFKDLLIPILLNSLFSILSQS